MVLQFHFVANDGLHRKIGNEKTSKRHDRPSPHGFERTPWKLRAAGQITARLPADAFGVTQPYPGTCDLCFDLEASQGCHPGAQLRRRRTAPFITFPAAAEGQRCATLRARLFAQQHQYRWGSLHDSLEPKPGTQRNSPHIDPRYISEVEHHDTPSPTVQQKIGRPKRLLESLPGFTAARYVWFVVRTRCRAMMLSRLDDPTDILSPSRKLTISFHLLASTPCGHISLCGFLRTVSTVTVSHHRWNSGFNAPHLIARMSPAATSHARFSQLLGTFFIPNLPRP
jgi:hypothetical protein